LRRHDSPSHFPPGVVVVEDVPHEDVLRAFRHCTIALVPSRWPDPCPLVALEAMAAGAPVIASATGGLVEQVDDGTTGRLVPPGDVGALRTAIADLLADPEARRRMGAAGRERATAYSASVVVPRIEAVYREVTAERSSPVVVAGAR
jgi:glycosyltransferase involved in cell wall biosynthesis